MVGTEGQRAHSQEGTSGPRHVAARWLQELTVRYAGVRITPGRHAAIAVGLLALAAAGATVWWVLASRPNTIPVSHPAAVSASAVGKVAPHGTAPAPTGAGSGESAAVPAEASTTAGPATVVVDVAGKVRHPGVYRLPAGSRVNDAINAAGGALPKVDLSSLNLAAKLSDGEQIAVGVAGAKSTAPRPGSAGAGGSGEPPGPVDLNTASLHELEALPGVGPVLAKHILDWRAAHGGFSRVDQLREVSGIGPVTFADLRELVTV